MPNVSPEGFYLRGYLKNMLSTQNKYTIIFWVSQHHVNSPDMNENKVKIQQQVRIFAEPGGRLIKTAKLLLEH